MSDKPYNLLVPMAGLGKRFKDEGYPLPKQVLVAGEKTLIEISLDCLDLDKYNITFIVRDEQISNYNMDEFLHSKFGHDINIVVTNGLTEGSVCSCLLARKYIDSHKPLIIHTLDVQFSPNFEVDHFDHHNSDGMILTAKSNSPNYSYVKMNDFGDVVETAEKKVISENACVGVYCYSRGSDFCRFADEMVSKEIKTNGEYYITPMYNLLIDSGLKIKNKSVDKLHVFGTPSEYEFYCESVIEKALPIGLCSDHSGFKEQGIPYVDFGCFSTRACDYADYVSTSVDAMKKGRISRCFGFCRSGQGVNMCANKNSGVRSALVYDEYSAEMAVRHNCANFFVFPERGACSKTFEKYVNIIKSSSFDGGRHQARVMRLESQ